MDKIEEVKNGENNSELAKTKRNTNLLIKLLRELPILDKKPGKAWIELSARTRESLSIRLRQVVSTFLHLLWGCRSWV